MESKRRVIHSIKVGIALVLVSLLYLLDPTFKHFEENTMWAIMTVIVVFEFYAGATIGKCINRGIGTILGGGLGSCAALLANTKGRVFEAIVVGSSLFIFGTCATYMRLQPKIKRKYDYAALIFILTFSLVLVSSVRLDDIVESAVDRLTTVIIGLVICLCISVFIFPVWASDELHYSIASKFENLASCIDAIGFFEELYGTSSNRKSLPNKTVQSCKSVLHAKANEESLANFARWEPWHGKFGFSHPWKQYLEIGEILRELAAMLFTLNGYLQSSRKPSLLVMRIEKQCEIMMLSLGWILRELGESIKKMKQSVLITPKLQSMKIKLDQIYSTHSMIEAIVQNEENDCDNISTLLLMEILEKIELLAKEVEGLGKLANFRIKTLDV